MRVCTMAIYHFFSVDGIGRVVARAQHEYGKHADAFAMARAISNGHDIEIWCGTTRIALRKRDRLEAVARRIQVCVPALEN